MRDEEIILTQDGDVVRDTVPGNYSFELPVDLAGGTIEIKNVYGRVRHTFVVGSDDENHEIGLVINDTQTTITSTGVSYPFTIVVKSIK